MNNKITNWNRCQRDDFHNIPIAQERGWSPIFSTTDKRYNRITPEYPPHDCVSFSKGNVRTWKCFITTSKGYFPYWRVADIIDGQYCNHRNYDDLSTVFEQELVEM